MLPRELQSLVSCFRKRPIFNGGRGFSNLAGPVLAKDLWTGWSSTGGAVVVPGRAFLRVFGQDTLKFLQGLVTNQVNLLAGEVPAQYAAFLSPQGRVLYDAFLYRLPASTDRSHEILVECDASMVDGLRAHLKKYQLRLRAKIADVSEEYQTWHAWPGAAKSGVLEDKTGLPDILSIKDPRHNGFGWRIVGPNGKDLISARLPRHDASVYTLRRVLCGIPEGHIDLPSGTAFPLESNLDKMNGVDFHKGCYVGQELTTRTHSRGVTRKRIMPVQIFASDSVAAGDPIVVDPLWSGPVPPAQALIQRPSAKEEASESARERRQAEMGKFCSGIYNVGLALLRLEALEGDIAPLQVDAGEDKKMYLRAFAPL